MAAICLSPAKQCGTLGASGNRENWFHRSGRELIIVAGWRVPVDLLYCSPYLCVFGAFQNEKGEKC